MWKQNKSCVKRVEIIVTSQIGSILFKHVSGRLRPPAVSTRRSLDFLVLSLFPLRRTLRLSQQKQRGRPSGRSRHIINIKAASSFHASTGGFPFAGRKFIASLSPTRILIDKVPARRSNPRSDPPSTPAELVYHVTFFLFQRPASHQNSLMMQT